MLEELMACYKVFHGINVVDDIKEYMVYVLQHSLILFLFASSEWQHVRANEI
jgi:hypothetical protein